MEVSSCGQMNRFNFPGFPYLDYWACIKTSKANNKHYLLPLASTCWAVLLFLKIESSYLSGPPSLPAQLGKAWHSVGGLIDGSQGTGSPISGLAKRLSSATYQPYKHPPESTLLQRGEGREKITGVAGRQKWALRTEGGKWEIEGGRRMLKEQRGGSTAFSLAICFMLVFVLMVSLSSLSSGWLIWSGLAQKLPKLE